MSGSGKPKTPFVVRDCTAAKNPSRPDPESCAYYQYLQGTSMASPHAVGVVALIVSRHGIADPVHGGLTLDPATVEEILAETARDHACPEQNPFDYPDEDLGPEYTAQCDGTDELNGFYGHGIIDALAAVSGSG